jgi:hypothetical protein
LVPEGEIWFYRPSNPGKDFRIPLQINDSNFQAVSTAEMDQGRWIIKLDWEMKGKGYYFEQGVVLYH